MAIEIICQGCSKKLRVPDEHAGKQARCPECGAIMAIPASALPTRAATGPFLGSPQTAPPDKWYLQTEDGHSYGPVPRAELDRWVTDGRVTARSMLRREDEVNGTLATQLYPQLTSSTSATSGQFSQAGANPFADRPVAPVSPVNPYAAPTSYGGKYRQAHRGGAWILDATNNIANHAISMRACGSKEYENALNRFPHHNSPS